MPNLRAMFSNLRAPMPLGRKLRRLLVNNWTKIRTRSPRLRRTKRGHDGNWEVHVMNADGSGQSRLTDNPAVDGGAAWSP